MGPRNYEGWGAQPLLLSLQILLPRQSWANNHAIGASTNIRSRLTSIGLQLGSMRSGANKPLNPCSQGKHQHTVAASISRAGADTRGVGGEHPLNRGEHYVNVRRTSIYSGQTSNSRGERGRQTWEGGAVTTTIAPDVTTQTVGGEHPCSRGKWGRGVNTH